jgi:hypothetical protein
METALRDRAAATRRHSVQALASRIQKKKMTSFSISQEVKRPTLAKETGIYKIGLHYLFGAKETPASHGE